MAIKSKHTQKQKLRPSRDVCKDARNDASVRGLCAKIVEKERNLRKANTGKATNDDHQDEAWHHVDDDVCTEEKSEEQRENRKRLATKYFLSTL